MGTPAPCWATQRLGHLALETRDQPLAVGQQAAVIDEAGADPALDRLDQHRILAADLVVELDQLARGIVVHVGAEEVVEEADGAFRRFRPDGTDREIGEAGIDVQLQRRPD